MEEYKGLVFFENGEIATYSLAEMIEITKGNVTAQGYAIYTFEDESTQVTKFQGAGTSPEGKPISFKGSFTYIRGTGRFEGIQGSGSFSGKFFHGFGPYWDFTGTYTLPER